MKILDAAGMREVDRRAIEQIGIPSLVLMENAASGVADAIGTSFPTAERVAIVCGPGNNGGDGLALARLLWNRGYEVVVALVHGGKSLSGDAATQRSIVGAMGLEILDVGDADELEDAVRACRGTDLIVDALFGTGLDRPLEGIFATAVEAIDELEIPLLAVDVPSGLDASRAEPIGPNTHARLTVALGAPKRAHVFAPASEAVGDVAVVDLGLPAGLIEEAPGIELLEAWRMADLLPPRGPTAHKRDLGHLLVVAGAEGTLGAALLTTKAALRSGAGLVTLAVAEQLAPFADTRSLESMTLGLPAVSGGRIGADAVGPVLEACAACDALAMGPGTGADGETGEALREIALRAGIPLVLDADGINAFAGRGRELRERSISTILTPHPGELGRLLGRDVPRTASDRLEAVLAAAQTTGAVVILKGHQTLIADPKGRIALNPTGNPGMATGGTGDVLTGVAGAMLARGLDPFDVACLAAFVHGSAGDLALEEAGEEGLVAGDLVAHLSRAFRDLSIL